MRTPEQVQVSIISCRDERSILALQKEYALAVESERRNAPRNKSFPVSKKRMETNLVIHKTRFDGKRLIIID